MAEKHRRPSNMEFSQSKKIEVMQRAKYRCEDCGKHKKEVGKLEIHHVVGINIAIKHHPELSHAMISSLANAKCLCHSCHLKRDKVDSKNHETNARALFEHFMYQMIIEFGKDEEV